MKNLFILMIITLITYNSIAQVNGYNIGEVVSNFTITDINGTTHDLYEYTESGKWVYLDFFKADCIPCQYSTPAFNMFYEKYGCGGYDIICLSISLDFEEDVMVYTETYGGNYNKAPAIGFEGGEYIPYSSFSIAAYPTFCLIGPDSTLKESNIPAHFTGLEGSLPDSIDPQECIITSNQIGSNRPQEFYLYPNPVKNNGSITINHPTLRNKKIQIEIINNIGTIMFSKHFFMNNKSDLEINTSLPTGNYIIQISNDREKLFSGNLSIIND